MNNTIIDIKFNEWTKGLSPVQARISLFEHIRDIPYALVPELRNPHTGPAGLLELCKGSCIPKHFLLGSYFTRLDIPVKYASYLYNWNDKAVRYPPEVRHLVAEMPITAHLALKAYIDGRWVLVDATWDLPLKRCGFPVNEKWDGFSNCKCAVKPIEEIIHETLDERVWYSNTLAEKFTEQEKAAYAKLTEPYNKWLEAMRSR